VADIIFHPEAQEEYDRALAWYQARSIRAAARFEAEVERILGLVQLNPESFPAYDDEHRFAVLRRFPYTLVYLVHADRILVVAVVQAGKRPGYWQGRA
jgi:plasmid stabilization system protein ParE